MSNSEVIVWLGAGTVSYLVGAVPTGLLTGLAKGVDIRKIGSGNIGATNVLRALGKGWGLFTLVIDALKGLVPVLLFPMVAEKITGRVQTSELSLLCGVLAVMGHNWPVYLGFKGGKGVATSTGALVGLAPWCALAGFGVWLLVFLSTRYVSLASISAAVAICVLAWVTTMKDGFVLPLVLTLLAIILIWKHRENIGRLLRGNENRIELRKKKGLEGTP